jgi:putative transposase
MTQDHSALLAQLDALKSADAGAVFAELIRAGLQALIEAEATEVIGAGRYQRSVERSTHRNGHRRKTISTTAGDVEVQIPKLRAGSFFPSLLERRRRIDKALHAVIMEAYVHGVSTRSVDDLVAALGVRSGVSKSEVSRICAGLDREIEARDRGVSQPQPDPHVVSVRVLRCHLLQGPHRRPCGLPGAGGGHRGVHRRHP